LKVSDTLELLALAALWGGSFLFTRMSAAEFGPVALIAVRVAGATLCLLPLLFMRGQMKDLRLHWRAIFVVGITNSALPFLCFGYAALSITAGLSAVFNAASPLFGALIAWLWLRDSLTPSRVVGLGVGFGGVLWLVWDKANFKAGDTGWATLACVAATLLYGLSANLAKKYLQGVSPLAIATGSQLSATIALAIPAAIWWPQTAPSSLGWLAAALLAIPCTGLAYVIYFRLIANIGPANAIAVTFLIPVFAVIWGYIVLNEQPSVMMLLGCAVIVVGTALVTGLVGWPSRVRAGPEVPHLHKPAVDGAKSAKR
jgi:drug/metabolite transporter (DMT)-like permease